MNLKKIILIIFMVLVVLAGIIIGIVTGQKEKSNSEDKIEIVTSNFACYDFLRAIVGEQENVELTFLLGPRKRCS